jgi:putative NADH-flavin reductase
MYKWQKEYIEYIKSCNKKNPVRKKRMLIDYKEKGYCEFEMWCLATTVAKFVLPRLKEFRNIVKKDVFRKENYAASLKDFDAMIYSFQQIVDNKHTWIKEEQSLKIQKGLDLFSKHLIGMWW